MSLRSSSASLSSSSSRSLQVSLRSSLARSIMKLRTPSSSSSLCCPEKVATSSLVCSYKSSGMRSPPFLFAADAADQHSGAQVGTKYRADLGAEKWFFAEDLSSLCDQGF